MRWMVWVPLRTGARRRDRLGTAVPGHAVSVKNCVRIWAASPNATGSNRVTVPTTSAARKSYFSSVQFA